MINRRQFLQGTGALFVAPAIVRAESLMPIYVPKKKIIFRVGADGIITPEHSFASGGDEDKWTQAIARQLERQMATQEALCQYQLLHFS